jgi:hypothetical protein
VILDLIVAVQTLHPRSRPDRVAPLLPPTLINTQTLYNVYIHQETSGCLVYNVPWHPAKYVQAKRTAWVRVEARISQIFLL